MTGRHPARFLLVIILALQTIDLGSSRLREHLEPGRAVVPAPRTALGWSNSSRENGSQQGWRPWESSAHSRASGESSAPVSSCCRNGGTCVLGSFCVCPAHFTGRYCEHDQRRRDCGALGHGTWTLSSCRLCRCIFATLHCLPARPWATVVCKYCHKLPHPTHDQNDEAEGLSSPCSTVQVSLAAEKILICFEPRTLSMLDLKDFLSSGASRPSAQGVLSLLFLLPCVLLRGMDAAG